MTTRRIRERSNDALHLQEVCLVRSLIQWFVILSIVVVDGGHVVRAEYVPSNPYLFATATTTKNKNQPLPLIQEYMRPDDANTANEGDGTTNPIPDRPDFLYDPQPASYRIVLYYLHWCATCRKFQPVFTRFAHKIHDRLASLSTVTTTTTKPLLQIYTVSCSPHRKLCQDQAIPGFPTIRFYRPPLSQYDDPSETQTETTTTTTDWNNHPEYYQLPHYTQLHPIKALALLGITLGDDDDDNDDPFVEENVWDAVESSATIKSSERVSFWRWLFSSSSLSHEVPSSSSHLLLSPPTRYRRTRTELMNDIHLSFDYAMRHELFRTTATALTSDERDALRQFLELAYRTLPSHWPMVTLITELVNNFVYIVKNEDYLLTLLDEFPAPTTQWSPSCSYHQPDDGYTCGLWELFHTITIGLVEYNENWVPTISVDAPSGLATAVAATTIRNYVAHFFGCTTCRDHFLAAFDTCQLNVCDRLSEEPIDDINDWMELSFWLYELHNMVNVRLFYEKHQLGKKEPLLLSVTEIQNVLYPSRRYECSACWKQDFQWNDHMDDADTTTTIDNTTTFVKHDDTALIHTLIASSYKSQVVYQYLRYEYGPRASSAASSKLRQEFHPITSAPPPSTRTIHSTPPTTTTTRRTASSSSSSAHHESPILIQLSYAGIFVLSSLILNRSSRWTKSTPKQRTLKVA